MRPKVAVSCGEREVWQYEPDRVGQERARDRLGHERVEPRIDRGHDDLGVALPAEHEHRRRPTQCPEPPGEGKPVHDGHLAIADDQVRPKVHRRVRQRPQRISTVGGLPEQEEPEPLHKPRHRLPQRRVVIDEVDVHAIFRIAPAMRDAHLTVIGRSPRGTEMNQRPPGRKYQAAYGRKYQEPSSKNQTNGKDKVQTGLDVARGRVSLFGIASSVLRL